MQGQLATGPRQTPYRLRSASDAVTVHKTGKRSAQVGGFDLCATAVILPHQRDRLEKLCRYILRPPIPESHLEYEGKLVILKLPRPRSDGTTRIAFEPAQFVERLSALIPKPRVNQILYHGVLAPGARLRAEVVRFGRPPPLPGKQTDEQEEPRRGRPSALWAEMMKRGLGLDVLTCPKCAGRMQYVATLRAPAEVRKILEHLGQWDDPDADGPPARAPPQDPGPTDPRSMAARLARLRTTIA